MTMSCDGHSMAFMLFWRIVWIRWKNIYIPIEPMKKMYIYIIYMHNAYFSLLLLYRNTIRYEYFVEIIAHATYINIIYINCDYVVCMKMIFASLPFNLSMHWMSLSMVTVYDSVAAPLWQICIVFMYRNMNGQCDGNIKWKNAVKPTMWANALLEDF